MKIRYLGHSCFLLTSGTGTRILTDPYDGIGFVLPRGLEADAVTVSHAHFDHANVSAVGGNPAVFTEAGEYEFGDVKIMAVKCWHDDAEGRKRGANLAFKLEMDGLRVCHMGDIGEKCSASLAEKLSPTDVLLLPVGGVYTVDSAGAKEYVDALKPSVVVPMHYKVEDLELNIAGVGEFTKLFDEKAVSVCGESEIELAQGDLGENQTKIIVLERSRTWI